MKKLVSLVVLLFALVVMAEAAAAVTYGTLVINGNVTILEYAYVCPGANVTFSQFFTPTTANANGAYSKRVVVGDFIQGGTVVATADWDLLGLFGVVNIHFHGQSPSVTYDPMPWTTTQTRTANIQTSPTQAQVVGAW